VSETITINYNDCVPPTITWIAPASNNTTVTNSSYSITAQIGNVSNAQGVVLTQNGQVLSNVTLTAGMLRRGVTLVSGVNTFVVTATNACGTVSETITINYNDCVPPTITGISPVQNNANVSNPNLTLTVQLQHITNAQTIMLTQNGASLTNFTYSNGTLTVSVTLNQGSNLFNLKASNGCGLINENLVINYKPLDEGNNGSAPDQKITICHYPDGSRVPVTMEILLSEWPAYQAKGAKLGSCAEKPAGNGNNNDGGINTEGNSNGNGFGGVGNTGGSAKPSPGGTDGGKKPTPVPVKPKSEQAPPKPVEPGTANDGKKPAPVKPKNEQVQPKPVVPGAKKEEPKEKEEGEKNDGSKPVLQNPTQKGRGL
jgi:hypothetical protein